jgi:macrolide-specific efflux system membrane fusion protein
MKKAIVAVILIVVCVAALLFFPRTKESALETIHPQRGAISVELHLNGSVQPRNRLEIKPQVSGRVESVLVQEGDHVKKGQTLAWMSSSDRAALLDAASAKGEEEVKKWSDIYKPAPIMAPMDGFIIARSKEPGQTIAAGEDLLVMSDTLIVEENVDETDLRNVSVGRRAAIFLDAYPDKKFPGVVEHVAYESTVINNVTVYLVKVRPERTPPAFRAGMTATVDMVAEKKDNVLMLPIDAVIDNGRRKFVMVKVAGSKRPERRTVETGISNGRQVEIVDGISEEDEVLSAPARMHGGGAAMPGGGIRGGGRSGGIGGIFGIQSRPPR